MLSEKQLEKNLKKIKIKENFIIIHSDITGIVFRNFSLDKLWKIIFQSFGKNKTYIFPTFNFENNKKYNRQRTAFYINSGFTCLLIGGTIWSYLNFNKNNIEPTYSKESPFMDKFSLNLTPYGCSLALKL